MADGTLDPEPINNYGKIQTTRTGRTDRNHERPGRRLTKRQAAAIEDFEDDRRPPPTWTADHVGYRLTMAFRIMNRTPKIRGPQSYGNGWPSIVLEAEDLKGHSSEDRFEALIRSAAKPTRAEITRMQTSFGWLEELRKYDSGVALQLMYWAAIEATRSRKLGALCRRKGWAYTTFWRNVNRGKIWLSDELNKRGDVVF